MSEKVKTKVIELLYSWTLALPEESKIKDAYHMLKRQGMCYLLSASKQREGWPRPGRTRGVSAVSGLPPFLLLKDNGKGLAGV